MLENHKKNRIESGFRWKKKVILFLSKSDWASLALRLSGAINRYTNWTAVCVSETSNVIENPLLSTNSKYEFYIRKVMRTADVIVYGSSFYGWHPFDEQINPNAFLGIIHPGTAYRKNHKLFNERVHPKLDFVVVGYDFQNLCDNPIVIFNPVDVEKYEVPVRPMSPIIVGHSPSGWKANMERGRALKGTHHLIDAMSILKKKYGNRIDIDIIQNVSLEECLRRKQLCHIFFDQIGDTNVYTQAEGELPMYGTSLIEAGSFGSVCLSHADVPDSPIFCVKNSDDIVNVISDFMDHPSTIMDDTRKWIFENHSYKSVGTKFIIDLERRLCGL